MKTIKIIISLFFMCVGINFAFAQTSSEFELKVQTMLAEKKYKEVGPVCEEWKKQYPQDESKIISYLNKASLTMMDNLTGDLNELKDITQEANQALGELSKITQSNTLEGQLLVASYEGKKDIVESLLTQGADPNKEVMGGPPLNSAVLKGNKDIVLLLIAKGAAVNGKDPLGSTSLMCAVSKRNIELVNILIDVGADVNLKNVSGKTALDIANQKGDEEIIDSLKKAEHTEKSMVSP